MSTFLGFESYVVSLGATLDQAKDTIRTALTSRGWQKLAESLQIVTALGTLGTVGNAFDGSATTVATSTTALPLWVGAQAPAAFTPVKMYLGGGATITESPSAFTLDYSDNGTVWTTLQTWTGETGWVPYGKRTYTVTGAAAHVYWRLTITAVNGSTTTRTLGNLVLEDASGYQLQNIYSMDVFPPATETIGSSVAFEFLRIRFTSTLISFYPMKKWTAAFPQQVYMSPLTAGAVTASCTLNGSTVSYVGASTNTAIDNLLGLYAAIRDSTNADFLAWDWEVSYPAPQNANDSLTYIYGINRTAQSDKTFTVSNVTGGIFANYIQAGFMTDEGVVGSPYTLTIDLTNGFVYYLQICSRGIAMATKTISTIYGPVHACWGANAAAVAYMPKDTKFITPIELVVGIDDDYSNTDSYAKTGTVWGLPTLSGPNMEYRDNYVCAPPSRGARRHRFVEVLCSTTNADSYRGFVSFQLKGSGMYVDDSSIGNDWQVHREKAIAHTTFTFNNSNNGYFAYAMGIVPGFEIDDWYKFRGTATSESLILISDTVAITQLSSNYAIGDTVLNLVDASAYQSSGFAIIGTEALQYTGKTGNQLTGITGAKYGTVAARHFTSDSVGQGIWYVVINGGALLAGYTKPTN